MVVECVVVGGMVDGSFGSMVVDRMGLVDVG